jgi:flavin-dependent dehydrogenase
LATRGQVLIEQRRNSAVADRVDSLPLPLLAALIELGIHPTEIGVSMPTSAVLTTWESATPTAREVAPKVNVDRHLLEAALLRKVECHPRIAIVDGGEIDLLPELRIDATGRRAVSAESIVEPPNPWFARTIVVPGRFGPAQQALRLAPFPGGYVYRLATPELATVGIVGPLAPSTPSSQVFDLVEDAGCGWTVSGLDASQCRPGRGGKASVQRAVPSRDWIAVGDAAFACDSLSSQGIASGISRAMKLVGGAPDDAEPGYRRHVGHVAAVIARNRFRDARAWESYADHLRRELENKPVDTPTR